MPYRLKGSIVEAIQYHGPEDKDSVRAFVAAPIDERGYDRDRTVEILTPNGWKIVPQGSWIMRRESSDEFFVLTDAEFVERYELFDGPF